MQKKTDNRESIFPMTASPKLNTPILTPTTLSLRAVFKMGVWGGVNHMNRSQTFYRVTLFIAILNQVLLEGLQRILETDRALIGLANRIIHD